jgi:hypothetical protein
MWNVGIGVVCCGRHDICVQSFGDTGRYSVQPSSCCWSDVNRRVAFPSKADALR